MPRNSVNPDNTLPAVCIIFDLDGTLVDSESLGNQAFLDLLPSIHEPVPALVERYRGQKLSLILADIERRYMLRLPDDFEARYRKRVSELFASALKPIPGARAMLEAVVYPRCIASSGPLEKIRHALSVTGLAAFFGNHIFSSYEVNSWKPDPGLFLHAAKAMGFRPEQCVVVDDSEIGLAAAKAAGMRPLRYAPEAIAGKRSEAAVFGSLLDLPRLFDQIAREISEIG